MSGLSATITCQFTCVPASSRSSTMYQRLPTLTTYVCFQQQTCTNDVPPGQRLFRAACAPPTRSWLPSRMGFSVGAARLTTRISHLTVLAQTCTAVSQSSCRSADWPTSHCDYAGLPGHASLRVLHRDVHTGLLTMIFICRANSSATRPNLKVFAVLTRAQASSG